MAQSNKRPALPEVQRLRKQATQMLASKRHDVAEDLVRQILAIDPNNADALRILSICMFRFRRMDEAMNRRGPRCRSIRRH